MDKYGLLHIGKTGGTAANAVIKENNKRGVGEFVRCYKHRVGLRDVHDENMCERLMFFIREPVARYISAFNSRLRMGYPRHHGEWGPNEAIAFETFKTPNQLAEALGSEDAKVRDEALFAMNAIRHLRKAYQHYLGSVDLLGQEKDRIYFIGTTETFDDDFSLLRKLLGIDPSIALPTDDYGAHRTPDGFEKTVSEAGRRNVQAYYKEDYEIYHWCLKRRAELLPLRLAETAE
ncbi:MAG: sulfotransferase family 2 domain-containing protein [Rhizobiaceae bacterium]|nr:sulfotransferase family 2 domain-containing protein [Rhizobiaceae bacterium]